MFCTNNEAFHVCLHSHFLFCCFEIAEGTILVGIELEEMASSYLAAQWFDRERSERDWSGSIEL